MTRSARILAHTLHGLARAPLRTALLVLGTWVGVCALIVIVALGRGTQSELVRRMDRILSGSSVYVRAGGHQFRPGARMPAPPTTLTLDDARALEQELPAVALADAMTQTVVTRAGNMQQRVVGHTEKAELVWNRSVTRGRYFTAAEVAGAARVALVGAKVAAQEFGERDPIGEELRVGAVPFRVIGVLEPAGIDPHGIDKDMEIVIPVTTLMRRIVRQDHVMGIRLALANDFDVDSAAAAVSALLRRRHRIAPGALDDFTTYTPAQVQRAVRATNRVFTVFLPLAAGASILMGGLIVGALMLGSVNTRRAEIGLRTATGARERDIRLQFLAECAAVTAAGGVAAVPVGYVILLLLGQRAGAVPAMPWDAVAIGCAAAVAVGLVAGMIPARRAARLDPARALRT